ncbi:MAG: hypothetical protein C0516_01140 [Gemmatimonas sp.]|nr:hypothetical protein [Gemmatimonas sp.]
MTDNQPQVSVILDSSVPSAAAPATVASILAQSEQRWELLLWRDPVQAATLASFLADARIRLLDRTGSAVKDEQRLREAVRGRHVAWIASGAVWPMTHLTEAIAGLRDTARDVHIGVTASAIPTPTASTSAPAHALAALCVEEGAAVSTLVCTRAAFDTDHMRGLPFALCDTWARALRMLQRHLPVLSTARPEGLERELSLDLLPAVLCDMLRLHHLAGPLAHALPRAPRHQRAMRESLWRTLSDGLTPLRDATTPPRLASMLGQIADATLDYGQRADLLALRNLLDRAREVGLRDLSLHHALLATERGLDNPMGVVLRSQSGEFPLDVVQASELVAALRRLDNTTAAEQVVALLDVELPDPRSVMALSGVTRRHATEGTIGAPEWLTDLPVDVEHWHEASRAYSVLGLTQAARLARDLATNPIEATPQSSEDRTRPGSAGEPWPWLDAIDRDLRRALTERRTLLAPVLRPGPDGAAAGFLEPNAQQLEDGAFERWLHELLLDPVADARVVQYLEQLEAPQVFVDLHPDDGRRLMQALQVPHCAAVAAMAPTALHCAQWQRAAGPSASRLHVVQHFLELRRVVTRQVSPVLLHAPLTLMGVADAMSCMDALSSSQTPCAILWSGTDVPSLWSEPGFQQMIEATKPRELHITALMWGDRQYVRLPIPEAPRAHLLLTEAHRVDA